MEARHSVLAILRHHGMMWLGVKPVQSYIIELTLFFTVKLHKVMVEASFLWTD
jgi:hypothetical protein